MPHAESNFWAFQLDWKKATKKVEEAKVEVENHAKAMVTEYIALCRLRNAPEA